MGKRPTISTLPLTILRIAFVVSLCFPSSVFSLQPATLPYHDCFSGNVSQKLNISAVYAQVVGDGKVDSHLNLTVFGSTGQPISGQSNDSLNLATLFTSASMLTFNIWTNSTYFCSSLRPPSPLPQSVGPDNTTYCPIPAGSFAFSSSVPWSDNHQLTTVNTRLRGVDPFSMELLCLDVATTPLHPGRLNSPYGEAAYILWATVALTIAYWLLEGIARIVAALGRGASRPAPGWWPKVESAGFILASALSGERLATSRALLRFTTPSMRDIIFHTQWCAALAMVAVQWPGFAYPILTQTGWAMLSYNITLSKDVPQWDPLGVPSFSPPSEFADQIKDPTSPIHMDLTSSNTLFMLPLNATFGLSSFASTIGLRPQDLFTVGLGVFLFIIAGTIVLSLLVWMVDLIASTIVGSGGISGVQPTSKPMTDRRSGRFSTASNDASTNLQNSDEGRALNGMAFRPSSRLLSGQRMSKSWFKLRPDISSFHWSVLHGNLVRILVWFHLPVTIFSCYQMTMGRSHASLSSIVLAAFSFLIFSLLIPALLILKVTITTTSKLYDETRTLLAFGPLYNHYRQGSQLFVCLLFATNLAFGITIGCGQKSGTAQAIIILVVEVVSALVTSVWLPWGQGASMGLISFLFCVARIVIAVLLVILTPTISIGDGAGGWVAYGILLILGLVYFAFALMLLVKFVEAGVRIFGKVGFDHRVHVVDSGLLSACGLVGLHKPRRHQRGRKTRSKNLSARDLPSETSTYSLPPNLHTLGRGSVYSEPPSVLRPEHALRPYREEGDDEGGFIMGAWQPFPRPGYSAVTDQPPTPPATSTGFSRVAGGRAHYDSPYAIAPGSNPSVGKDSAGSTQQPLNDYDEPLATSSVPSFTRQHSNDLTPAASMPTHVRRKSQTAIVEHTSAPPNNNSVPSPLRLEAGANVAHGDVLEPADTFSADSHDPELSPPKKWHWFQLRKNRWHSDSDAQDAATAGEAADPEASTGKGSFVVIRDRKPQGQPRLQQLSAPEPSRHGADGSALSTTDD